MKVKYFLLIFLITALLAGFGVVKKSNAAILYGIDINKDGVISMEEWQGNQRTFEERDWNDDGILSGLELSPGMKRSLAQAMGVKRLISMVHIVERPDPFASLDRNKDSLISFGEWNGTWQSFNQVDADRNGFLTRAEYNQR